MELGSEYNLALSELNVVSDNLYAWIGKYRYELLDSGRGAIKLANTRQGKVLLPEYICEAVITCFAPENVLFYRVREDFSIDADDLMSKLNDEVGTVFFAHYFGACQPWDTLVQLRKTAYEKGILLIEDTTQSLFSIAEISGDYAVASIRKWLPIPCGGILYSTGILPAYTTLKKSSDNERVYAMVLKDLFLKKRLDSNLIYREIFEDCEKGLDCQQEVFRISDFSKFVISCIHIDSIQKKRQENYRYLKGLLEKFGLKPALSLAENDTPFAFPLRVANRDPFRRYLIENQIYCAVHWPYFGEMTKERQQSLCNADTLISLPIDQRYTKKDMEYMAEVIAGYGGELRF